ncbi:MAG: phospholipid carrier-dependent glycosyltransferase [Candidatus Omnitrophota bacterium]
MRSKIYTIIAVLLILAFAAALRIDTFWLPHNHGDQIYYLGLAMKLENSGLKDYNLKGLNVLSDKNQNILAVVPSEDKDKGELLTELEKDGVRYYSMQSISNMPPAYSFLLMLSHKIFSPNKEYLSVNRNLGLNAFAARPKPFFHAQFYAVWINFAFSLLLILVVFLLGKAFFNEQVGLWAALLMSITPVNILTSQRLWADDMTALFSALGVLLFWQGRKKNNLVFTILSGLSVGIAALTKGTGLFIIAVIFFSVIIIEMRQVINKYLLSSLCVICAIIIHSLKDKGLIISGVILFLVILLELIRKKNRTWARNVLLNKHLILFITISVAACAFWYTKLFLTYGNIAGSVKQDDLWEAASWFKTLKKRNPFGQLYYFVYLSPLFLLFYIEAVKTIIKKFFSQERIVLLVWFAMFMVLLIPSREERYMLPAYPAIAILSAVAIENIRIWLNKRCSVGNIVVFALFLITSVWSIRIALHVVYSNGAIFAIK